MVDFKSLINKAKQIEDQSEATAGGNFEYVPPAEGRALARFVEYIELGQHAQTHEGKPKPDADEVRLTFDLLSPRYIKEIEVEGGKKTVCDRISVKITKKFNEKASFYKLFKIMQMGRSDITHMAEMLGEAFFLDIVHSKSPDGKVTYANFRKDQVWLVTAPRIIDPVTNETTDYSSKVPPAMSPIKLFLWDIPTKETWDSLFIDGSTEVKNSDGTTTTRSHNRWQELIMSAKNFGGSALEQMLGGLDNLPTESKQESQKSEEQASTPTTEKSADASGAGAGTNTPDDDLAALGLM